VKALSRPEVQLALERAFTQFQASMENQKQNKDEELLHSFRFLTPNRKRIQVDFISFTLFDELENEHYDLQ
jgi:hypothetical protein